MKIKIEIEREYCKYCGNQIPPTRETCPVCYKKAKKYFVIKKVNKSKRNKNKLRNDKNNI